MLPQTPTLSEVWTKSIGAAAMRCSSVVGVLAGNAVGDGLRSFCRIKIGAVDLRRASRGGVTSGRGDSRRAPQPSRTGSLLNKMHACH